MCAAHVAHYIFVKGYIVFHAGTLHALGWTDDGQLLTVSTLSGKVISSSSSEVHILLSRCSPHLLSKAPNAGGCMWH